MPAVAFAHGGAGQGGRGGEHAFVGGGHASGGFTGRGFSPGFGGPRGYPTGRFSGREDHGRFGDRSFRDHRCLFSTVFLACLLVSLLSLRLLLLGLRTG